MKHALIIVLILPFAGCSSIYPVGGAMIGGGAGSLAGPAGAAIGAGVGYGAGKLGQLASDNKDLVKAVTKGDVAAMVAAASGKNQGFMDEALDTVYGFIKLCLIGVLIYTLAPIFYTRYILRKVIKDNGKAKKSS